MKLIDLQTEVVHSPHDGGYYLEQSAIRWIDGCKRATFRTSRDLWPTESEAIRALSSSLTVWSDWT